MAQSTVTPSAPPPPSLRTGLKGRPFVFRCSEVMDTSRKIVPEAPVVEERRVRCHFYLQVEPIPAEVT